MHVLRAFSSCLLESLVAAGEPGVRAPPPRGPDAELTIAGVNPDLALADPVASDLHPFNVAGLSGVRVVNSACFLEARDSLVPPPCSPRRSSEGIDA